MENDKPKGGCPFHINGPVPYGTTDLNYNQYLKIDELVGLQSPQSNPAHHDELLFIVIHQAYELWFKLIIHEMEAARSFMDNSEILKAHHFMKRVCEVMKILVPQIHLLETMTPVDFLKFRDRLKPASGFQSLQFREIEFLAGLKDEKFLQFFEKDSVVLKRLQRRLAEPDLGLAYLNMLKRLGFKLPVSNRPEDRDAQVKGILPIYQKPSDNTPLYLLSESLVEFDEYLGLWRDHHVRVIERIIGFKQGTGGSSGAEYLRTTTTKKCFPVLWEVRTALI